VKKEENPPPKEKGDRGSGSGTLDEVREIDRSLSSLQERGRDPSPKKKRA